MIVCILSIFRLSCAVSRLHFEQSATQTQIVVQHSNATWLIKYIHLTSYDSLRLYHGRNNKQQWPDDCRSTIGYVEQYNGWLCQWRGNPWPVVWGGTTIHKSGVYRRRSLRNGCVSFNNHNLLPFVVRVLLFVCLLCDLRVYNIYIYTFIGFASLN